MQSVISIENLSKSVIRDLIDVVYQRWLNRVSAVILFGFGVVVLASLVV